MRRRRETYDRSLDVLAARLARAARDREPVRGAGWTDALRELGLALGLRRDAADSPKQLAMHALAQRLDRDIRANSDQLIALHGLGGHASADILTRLADHYAVHERLSEGKAAALGSVVTGALAGLKADLASGGMTFGAGLLVGGVLGALGGAGIARGYNRVRGVDATTLTWSEAVLDELAQSALLGYLAVAHYGRGRGAWAESEYPAHWQTSVAAVLARRREAFRHAWSLRGEHEAADALAAALREAFDAAATDVLQQLYPEAMRACALQGEAAR
jgi:hypothetical protein